MRLFSTEQVSMYHPDKFCDQISDAVLDACLKEDKDSHVAIECMAKGNMVVVAGEVTTKAKPDYEEIINRVAGKLGYEIKSRIVNVTEQSPEIAGGVKSGENLRAGDQGIMFGYACNETPEMLPYGFAYANRIIQIIEEDVARNKDRFKGVLKGDAKCQVTVDLDAPKDSRSLVEILVSVCHEKGFKQEQVKKYVKKLFVKAGLDTRNAKITINPAGEWTIGGPEADCGLTGRKIVCDQYGGYCPVGGGAFSGKDPSKVDRSAAYMARKIACDMVIEHDLSWCEVELAYAIGEAEPMSVIVHSPLELRDSEYTAEVKKNYDLTPYGIIKALNLLNENYEKLAEGCHFRYGGFV